MEKEIIIDGVKVEECSYYNKDNTPYCCEEWDNECEAQNCYYKQLKRLQQDYVNLSKSFEHLQSSYQENQEYFLQLKAENEKLKKEMKNNKSAYEVELGAYNMECGNLLEENKQLFQTLQEIKAIAENCMSKDGCFECKYSDDCYIEDAEFPTYDICKLLIQKITKAEEE